MEQSGGGPLCPMGVTMDLALRIVTGLTNVFGGWGGGRGEGAITDVWHRSGSANISSSSFIQPFAWCGTLYVRDSAVEL